MSRPIVDVGSHIRRFWYDVDLRNHHKTRSPVDT